MMLLFQLICIWNLFVGTESQRDEQFYRKLTSVENSILPGSLLKTIQSPSQISCALKCKNYAGCTTIGYDATSKDCNLFQGIPKQKEIDKPKQNYFTQISLDCQRAGTAFKKELKCCDLNYAGKNCNSLVLGLKKSRPAPNCTWIFDKFPRAKSSIYWIQGLPTEEPEEIFCEKISDNEINTGTLSEIMTCKSVDESMKYEHPDVCGYYIICSRNQAWALKCSTTSSGTSKYSETEKQCVKEGCFKNQGDICYGAKDNSFGEFIVTKTGFITHVKLVHRSGYLANTGNPKMSKWGFQISSKIGTLITDEDDNIMFGSLLPYKLRNFNGQSEYIIVTNATTAFVESGTTLRVWYTEDIRNVNEDDNHGTHCITVYAEFNT